MAIQPDGKIIAGGQSGPNDLSRRYFGLARYLNDCFYATDKSIIQSSNILTAVAADLTYQWVDCENDYMPVADGTNQTYTATQNGTYAVIFTDGACVDTSECVVVNTVGVEDAMNLNAITISPNPFDNNLNITLQTESGSNQIWQLELFNSLGQTVYASKISNGEVEINTATFLSGIYILKCHQDVDNKSFILIKN